MLAAIALCPLGAGPDGASAPAAGAALVPPLAAARASRAVLSPFRYRSSFGRSKAGPHLFIVNSSSTQSQPWQEQGRAALEQELEQHAAGGEDVHRRLQPRLLTPSQHWKGVKRRPARCSG